MDDEPDPNEGADRNNARNEGLDRGKRAADNDNGVVEGPRSLGEVKLPKTPHMYHSYTLQNPHV